MAQNDSEMVLHMIRRQVQWEEAKRHLQAGLEGLVWREGDEKDHSRDLPDVDLIIGEEEHFLWQFQS